MRVHRAGEPLGAATARARHDQSGALSVALFQTLIQQLDAERRWVVLDLGALHAATLELLQGYRCRLEVADIVWDLMNSRDVAGSLRLDDWDEPVDLVFCWDVLNYLEEPVLADVMGRIAQRCRPGALVHALVVYSEKVMNDLPGYFVPVDSGKLVDTATQTPQRKAPRYSTEALSKAMPDYAVDRVRLLGNGMQEYLFKRRELKDIVETPRPRFGIEQQHAAGG